MSFRRIRHRPETKEDSRTGRYTIRTFWAGNGTQLNSAIDFRTKDSRDAQLIIVRQLADGGKTLTLNGTLKVAGEPQNVHSAPGLAKARILRVMSDLSRRRIVGLCHEVAIQNSPGL